MYTTIIHPIRKALCLSIEEYCVLDSIYHLSNNHKYGHWCVMSKDRIAKMLDFSRATVFRILETLEAKELIERDENTGYIRSLDSYNEMIANKEDWLIGFNGKETALLSAKQGVQSQNETGSLNLTQTQSQNETMDSLKMRLYNNKYNNIYNTLEPFEIFWKAYPKKKSKGQAEKAFKKVDVKIEVLLEAIEKAKKTVAWQKNGGQFIPYPATWLNAKGWEDEESTVFDLKFYKEEYESMNQNDAAFIKKYGIDTLKKLLTTLQ